MPPIDLLLALLLLTLTAWVIDRWRRSKSAIIYRQLAIAHGMHYSPGDPLRLTARIAALLPVPGAAAVRVIDLFYRTDEDTHYYVFTAEFTVGVIGPKRRVRQVAAFNEKKATGTRPDFMQMGNAELTLIEQYRFALGMASQPHARSASRVQ